MIRWLILLFILVISGAFISFVELEPAVEWIVKSIYFTATILLVISLLLRDMRGRQLEG